jgi:hypothetical protein
MDTDRAWLARIATQLRRWADESQQGGWSTHQVKPMRALAQEIEAYLWHREAEDSRKPTEPGPRGEGGE